MALPAETSHRLGTPSRTQRERAQRVRWLGRMLSKPDREAEQKRGTSGRSLRPAHRVGNKFFNRLWLRLSGGSCLAAVTSVSEQNGAYVVLRTARPWFNSVCPSALNRAADVAVAVAAFVQSKDAGPRGVTHNEPVNQSTTSPVVLRGKTGHHGHHIVAEFLSLSPLFVFVR